MALSYTVELSTEAWSDLKMLRAYVRAKVLDHIEQFLTTNPAAVGPVRIKEYQNVEPPTYRLRVDDIRVVYRIEEESKTVTIATILPKIAAEIWVAQYQMKVMPDEKKDDSGSGGSATESS